MEEVNSPIPTVGMCRCGHTGNVHDMCGKYPCGMCDCDAFQYPLKGPDRPDPTNPPHYQRGGMEAIDVLQAMMSPEEVRGFFWGHLFKYIWRWPEKAGVEDLRKAKWYLDRLIAQAEGPKVNDPSSGN